MHRTSIAACAAAMLCVAFAPVPEVPRPATPGSTLITGDSMMSVLERDLRRELRSQGAVVQMDSRLGSGITKPFLFDWLAYAERQAAVLAPPVTIVFLGAGDVYPIRAGRREVPCCGPAWVAAYSRRAGRMLRSWLRGGSGRVYWLTLPTPRDATLARVQRAIDRAVSRAVARAGPGARRIDLVPVFTPGRRFRRHMVVDGRREVVRLLDGVHLAPAGARLAARRIRAVLERDGLL